MMYRYILAFGSNLGDRYENCLKGETYLRKFVDFIYTSKKIITEPLRSSKYETEDHEKYLNYICEINTSNSPCELYLKIVQIEDKVGHRRDRKWAPRSLDIDILFAARNDAKLFDDCSQINLIDPIQIPHCGLPKREFLWTLLSKYPRLVETIR